MTAPMLGLVAAQDALLAALDARDAGAIESATAALADAVAAARAPSPYSAKPELDHALRQNDAIRFRLAFMAEQVSDSLARLAKLRGVAPEHAYRRR